MTSKFNVKLTSSLAMNLALRRTALVVVAAVAVGAFEIQFNGGALDAEQIALFEKRLRENLAFGVLPIVDKIDGAATPQTSTKEEEDLLQDFLGFVPVTTAAAETDPGINDASPPIDGHDAPNPLTREEEEELLREFLGFVPGSDSAGADDAADAVDAVEADARPAETLPPCPPPFDRRDTYVAGELRAAQEHIFQCNPAGEGAYEKYCNIPDWDDELLGEDEREMWNGAWLLLRLCRPRGAGEEIDDGSGPKKEENDEGEVTGERARSQTTGGEEAEHGAEPEEGDPSVPSESNYCNASDKGDGDCKAVTHDDNKANNADDGDPMDAPSLSVDGSVTPTLPTQGEEEEEEEEDYDEEDEEERLLREFLGYVPVAADSPVHNYNANNDDDAITLEEIMASEHGALILPGDQILDHARSQIVETLTKTRARKETTRTMTMTTSASMSQTTTTTRTTTTVKRLRKDM